MVNWTCDKKWLDCGYFSEDELIEFSRTRGRVIVPGYAVFERGIMRRVS